MQFGKILNFLVDDVTINKVSKINKIIILCIDAPMTSLVKAPTKSSLT